MRKRRMGATKMREATRVKRFLSSALGTLLLSGLLVLLLPGIAGAVVPTRIMPLGDSITYGSNIAGAY
jgi:hypothetical protein